MFTKRHKPSENPPAFSEAPVTYDESLLLHAYFCPTMDEQLTYATNHYNSEPGLSREEAQAAIDQWASDCPTFEVQAASKTANQSVPSGLKTKLKEAQSAMNSDYRKPFAMAKKDHDEWRKKWEDSIDSILSEEQSKLERQGITVRRLTPTAWFSRPHGKVHEVTL